MDEDGVIAGQVAFPVEVEFWGAAKALAEARVRWAQAFQLARAREGSTDKQAAAAADEMTGCEVVVLEAELEIARRRLGSD